MVDMTSRPLLDEILGTDEDGGRPRLRARRRLLADEPVFAGHFPGLPVVPGVFVVEALAECARRLLVARGLGPAAALVGAPRVRFRRPVVPGDLLDLAATLTQSEGDGFRFGALASVDGRPAVVADLLLAVAPGTEFAQTAGV